MAEFHLAALVLRSCFCADGLFSVKQLVLTCPILSVTCQNVCCESPGSPLAVHLLHVNSLLCSVVIGIIINRCKDSKLTLTQSKKRVCGNVTVVQPLQGTIFHLLTLLTRL